MKNLTRLQFNFIPPKEYDFHYYLYNGNRKGYLKRTGLLVYYATFYYYKQKGYKYVLLSKEVFNDSNIDIHEYIKNKCYQWAVKNYGEIKDENRNIPK